VSHTHIDEGSVGATIKQELDALKMAPRCCEMER